MCTVYRLSVTPENIVVHNRGHFLQHCAAAALIYTAQLLYSYAELLHNKELMERRSKKEIALITLQAMCIVQKV